jgi:hypothetical protein
MAGTTNVYQVDYHFELGGKIAGPNYQASVSAAANDYNSIRTVLSNNGLLLGSGTLVIDNVQADPSGTQTIYT